MGNMTLFDRIAMHSLAQRLRRRQDALIEPDYEHSRPLQAFGGVDG